jgi:hypothetical protein
MGGCGDNMGRCGENMGCVSKISNLYCAIQQSYAQRSDVAGGSQVESQRSVGGRQHR